MAHQVLIQADHAGRRLGLYLGVPVDGLHKLDGRFCIGQLGVNATVHVAAVARRACSVPLLRSTMCASITSLVRLLAGCAESGCVAIKDEAVLPVCTHLNTHSCNGRAPASPSRAATGCNDVTDVVGEEPMMVDANSVANMPKGCRSLF